jgi:hypothetical protein
VAVDNNPENGEPAAKVCGRIKLQGSDSLLDCFFEGFEDF